MKRYWVGTIRTSEINIMRAPVIPRRQTVMFFAAATFLFWIGASLGASAEECTDGSRMTIFAVIKSIKNLDGGKVSITLTESAGCEIWGILADRSAVPARCAPGRDIEATGRLDDFMGYIATLEADEVRCD